MPEKHKIHKKIRRRRLQLPHRLIAKLKSYIVIIAAVLTVTIVFSVLFSAVDSNMLPHSYVSATPLSLTAATSATSSLQNFATDIASANGKVFTIDNWGIVNCFNAQTGQKVWSVTAGGYTAMPQSLEVYNGSVYVATNGGLVVSLDENTGEELLQFQAPVSSSIGEKTPPSAFSVGNGCVFVGSDGFAAYNATNGKQLWAIKGFNFSLPYLQAVWPLGDNVFLGGNQVNANFYGFFRVNPENDSALWYAPGYSSSPPLYSRGQVIFWNVGSTTRGGQTVISVNASSGAMLWNFSVGSSIYTPVIFNDLLFFAGSSGNFYAFSLVNGTLVWKTPVDPDKFMVAVNDSSPLIVSPVQIYAQNQRVIWGFLVNQSGPTGPYGSEQYAGILCSLSITNGEINWIKQIAYNGYISKYLTSSQTAMLGLAVANNTVYLTASSDPNSILPGGELWQIDGSTGAIQGTQQFDHYVLSPVEMDNKVFVAADLYLLSFQNANNIPEFPSWPILLLVLAVTAVVVMKVGRKIQKYGSG